MMTYKMGSGNAPPSQKENDMEYRYGMKYRGFSPGCQPKGVVRREDDNNGRYHDIIVYDRELTEKELSDYELEYLGYIDAAGN